MKKIEKAIGSFNYDGIKWHVFKDGWIQAGSISCSYTCLKHEPRRLAQNLLDDYQDQQDWLQACEQTKL